MDCFASLPFVPRERFQSGPLHEALDRNSRGIRGRLVAVDIRDNRLVSGGGPPLRDNDKEDLLPQDLIVETSLKSQSEQL